MSLKSKFGLRKLNILQASYPKWEIAIAVLLLFAAPFTTALLTYAALFICVCRVIVYDARVFATDYAILLPISQLFRANGMSLLIYLCLFAVLWYLFKGKIEKQLSYAVLLLLLNYLLLRMQWNISGIVICFGQLCLLCVLIPKQDEASAEQASKMFCLSMIVSSIFAYVLRDSSQLYQVRGSETAAFWGSSFNRFQGLFADPNYYTALLITAMALLVRLLDCRKIGLIEFVLQELVLLFFGLMTYSKTFFLLMLLLVLIGIICLFLNKKYLLCAGFVALIALIVLYVSLSGVTIFSVILYRFRSATSLDELTTGRSIVFAEYFEAITKDIPSLLFGSGMAARGLGKDPHNLYLEILYYLGIVGLLLKGLLIGTLAYESKKRQKEMPKQVWLSKYVVLIMVLALHFTLHGVFSIISYGAFFFALLPLLLVKREKEI